LPCTESWMSRYLCVVGSRKDFEDESFRGERTMRWMNINLTENSRKPGLVDTPSTKARVRREKTALPGSTQVSHTRSPAGGSQ